MAEKYTAAERRAFKNGMAAQYNREHPVHRYGVVTTRTYYNADGSVYSKSDFIPKGSTYKTKAEAVAAANRKNSDYQNKMQNERVLRAVKAKKVNDHDSSECSTFFYSCKKLDKPVRKGVNDCFAD